MDRCSYFIDNKALFGAYPSKEGLEELYINNVRHFIDLSSIEDDKRVQKYITEYNYIRFPIKDKRVPTNWKKFSWLIINIIGIIKNLNNNEKIYIHCIGGHGRSGILVACLLCYIYGIPPSDSITKTTEYHNNRKDMREKWRKIGSPQTRSQKHFVSKFFEPLYIYTNQTKYFSYDFNNESNFSVIIPNYGMFPNAKAAYYAFKDPYNNDYVGKLETAIDINIVEEIFCSHKITDIKWEQNKERYIFLILKYKFNQHEVLKNQLLNTGLRPIYYHSNDLFMGKIENIGKNILGKNLNKIREILISNIEIVNL